MSSRFSLTIIALLLASAGSAIAQQSSLYQNAVIQMTPDVPATGEDAGISYPASLTSTPKANPKTFAKNELITIIISESATHSTNGSRSTARDSSIDASVEEWVRLSLTGGGSGLIRPVNFKDGKPSMKMDTKRDFDGSGSSSRSDSLVARVTGRIVDIRPNGNLVIEASKRIDADGDAYTITVTGVCRTGDVTPGNTILSTELADLEIVKTAEGAVRDATKRSWLQRAFDFVNIF